MLDIFSGKKSIELDSIRYKRFENEDVNKDVQIKLSLEDVVSVETNEKYLGIVLQRILKFEPVSPFDLEVSFIIKHYLKEPDVDWEKIDVSELIEQNKSFFIQEQMETVSMLIAQITSAYGRKPIITPPAIIGEK